MKKYIVLREKRKKERKKGSIPSASITSKWSSGCPVCSFIFPCLRIHLQDAVAIKNANYPSGLINIRIITPLEYRHAVMNMGLGKTPV